jgi:hypothetical protein
VNFPPVDGPHVNDPLVHVSPVIVPSVNVAPVHIPPVKLIPVNVPTMNVLPSLHHPFLPYVIFQHYVTFLAKPCPGLCSVTSQ